MRLIVTREKIKKLGLKEMDGDGCEPRMSFASQLQDTSVMFRGELFRSLSHTFFQIESVFLDTRKPL